MITYKAKMFDGRIYFGLFQFGSLTALNSCVSTTPTKGFNNSSTTICSSWNKRNTRRRVFSGNSLTLEWICKLALILLKRCDNSRTLNKEIKCQKTQYSILYPNAQYIYVL